LRARAGTHFVAVFGAQQSALEALLLKRRIMGPSWLTLAQPVRVDAGVQARPVLRRHAAPVMSRPVTPASRAAPASRGGPGLKPAPQLQSQLRPGRVTEFAGAWLA